MTRLHPKIFEDVVRPDGKYANGSSNGYDGLNRLTNFRRGQLNAAHDTISTATTTNNWSLDALGNWTSTGSGSRTFNSQNQITSMPSGSTTPTYDNNGNTTADETGKTYVYDAWNRMVQANAGGTVTSFKYEALGQRASEALCTGTTTYSYFSAGWQDLEDDASGGIATKRTYVWGLGYIDDLVERDETIGSGSATRLYVQQDASFNVTALVNTAGTVVERFVYDPYGAATVLTNSWTTTTDSYNWAFRWKGGRYDSATGLYNFRFRDYSPTLGRWMQSDPAGYVDGANLYQAMLGAPIDTVDPIGLAGVSPTQPSGGAEAEQSLRQALDIVKGVDKNLYNALKSKKVPIYCVSKKDGGGLPLKNDKDKLVDWDKIPGEFNPFTGIMIINTGRPPKAIAHVIVHEGIHVLQWHTMSYGSGSTYANAYAKAKQSGDNNEMKKIRESWEKKTVDLETGAFYGADLYSAAGDDPTSLQIADPNKPNEQQQEFQELRKALMDQRAGASTVEDQQALNKWRDRARALVQGQPEYNGQNGVDEDHPKFSEKGAPSAIWTWPE